MTLHREEIGFNVRRVGYHHLAFLRGLLQRPDPQYWWQRYLEIEGRFEPRTARATLAWLRSAVMATALRCGEPRLAALFLRDPNRRAVDPNLPSLDAFARQFPEDFYSERELQALWAQAHPGPARRLRLVERQLRALRTIEPHLAQDPKWDDALISWFEPKVAQRLDSAGLQTVGDLFERVNGVGRHWWRAIAGIGPVAARRLLRWLETHAEKLGITLGPQVHTPRTQLNLLALREALPRATAVVPLERFVVPGALDGSQGAMRAPPEQCLLAARTDYEAILSWLCAQNTLHTQRAYRKEIERFMLWAILERKKPLSGMTLEDCLAYRAFLEDPQPRARWCGPRARERWSPAWRPFEGPLKPSSQQQALHILKSCYEWLMRQRYVYGNPWSGIKPAAVAGERLGATRSFTHRQWQFIEGQLAQLPNSGGNRRLKIALYLALGTGLRLSELIQARVRDLVRVELDPVISPDAFDEEDTEGYVLRVLGKGQKVREVPIAPGLFSLLQDYWKKRGLDPDPEKALSHTFLLGKIDDAQEMAHLRTPEGFNPHEGIAASTLYSQLKRFFASCAQARALHNKRDAAQIAKASTHWLRHTFGSHAVANDVPLPVVQAVMGHASLNTTTLYVTTERSEQVRAITRLWNKQQVQRERGRMENT